MDGITARGVEGVRLRFCEPDCLIIAGRKNSYCWKSSPGPRKKVTYTYGPFSTFWNILTSFRGQRCSLQRKGRAPRGGRSGGGVRGFECGFDLSTWLWGCKASLRIWLVLSSFPHTPIPAPRSSKPLEVLFCVCVRGPTRMQLGMHVYNCTFICVWVCVCIFVSAALFWYRISVCLYTRGSKAQLLGTWTLKPGGSRSTPNLPLCYCRVDIDPRPMHGSRGYRFSQQKYITPS